MGDPGELAGECEAAGLTGVPGSGRVPAAAGAG
jgi:hypothetical protein